MAFLRWLNHPVTYGYLAIVAFFVVLGIIFTQPKTYSPMWSNADSTSFLVLLNLVFYGFLRLLWWLFSVWNYFRKDPSGAKRRAVEERKLL